MSAIAGIIHFNDRPVDPHCLERMRNVLSVYGPDHQKIWTDRNAGLIRNLRRISPEDSFDRQPLVFQEGRFVLVSDGRIDNREDLAGTLGIPSRKAGLMADCDFIRTAYERWGDDCPKYLIGDFAFAIWDRRERKLLLARDYLGHRPLFWYQNDGLFAFATLSKALFALPDVPREICEERLASLLALIPMSGNRSFFKDIFRVEPSRLVVVQEGRVTTSRYHEFDPEHRIRFNSDAEYVERARELLEQAVSSCLRSSGPIASHCSSGLDSTSVTATAARLLAKDGKRLLAYTAVPREGFDGPVPKGRHADEGQAAKALASLYPNITHILIRPEGQTPVDRLKEQVESLDRAPLNPCNSVWAHQINQDASRRGVRVLLTGQMGNMTISYDGRPHLAALFRRGHWFDWLRESRALVRQTDMRMRGAVAQSIGPFVPPSLWRALGRVRGRSWMRLSDYTAISKELIERTKLRERADEVGWDLSYRPWADGWEMRTAVLHRGDQGEYHTSTVGAYGIEMRDPTSDRRLLEYCLAIPESQYLNRGRTRWLLKRLMEGVLPPEILLSRTKGLQAADWYEGAGAAREEIGQWLDRLEASSLAPRYLDLERMRAALEDWPEDGWATEKTIQTYRLMMLRGLSVGAFIDYVEGGNR